MNLATALKGANVEVSLEELERHFADRSADSMFDFFERLTVARATGASVHLL